MTEDNTDQGIGWWKDQHAAQKAELDKLNPVKDVLQKQVTDLQNQAAQKERDHLAAIQAIQTQLDTLQKVHNVAVQSLTDATSAAVKATMDKDEYLLRLNDMDKSLTKAQSDLVAANTAKTGAVADAAVKHSQLLAAQQTINKLKFPLLKAEPPKPKLGLSLPKQPVKK